MMKTQQCAYMLHRIPYRNTSSIAEFFTQENGIVSMICRGIRNNPKQRGVISFVPLWVEYTLRGELASLNKVEPQAHALLLSGKQLYCGLYLNELLLKLLSKHDSYPALFEYYHHTLQQLASNDNLEKTLRCFELTLLNEIGYGIQFNEAAHTALPIKPEKYYAYQPSSGFHERAAGSDKVLQGATILALGQQQFDNIAVLKAAKAILRMTLDHLLGNRTLNSRELFIKKEYSHE